MKKLFVLFLFLISFATQGQSLYSIKIDDHGYLLTMKMKFSNSVNLNSVRQAFKNGFVLSKLSPNIKKVINTPTDSMNYESLMTVKSFGIKSQLLSSCEESKSDQDWSRKCVLHTDKEDGGKYMEWKEDFVQCKILEGQVDCSFEIKGKAKPVKVLGIQIMNERLFSVKAKYSALGNFFKQYFFIKNFSSSTKAALNQYETSAIKKDIEAMSDEATKVLKSEPSYVHTYTLVNE